MKICVVHNAYGKLSGEEVAVQNLSNYMRRKNHSVVEFFRDSASIPDTGLAKAGALLSGIYSFAARREFSNLLDAERPDLVHVNNLYPLISTSILDESKRRRIPTVMTLHNYRLACPTGLMMSRGEICRRCVTDGEWQCAVRNCTGDVGKSVGYALRNWVARLLGVFHEKVDHFVAPSRFLKSVLVESGYPSDRISVAPYVLEIPPESADNGDGEYVGYVGRISPEKGVDVIVEAARRLPEIPFKFAGDYARMPEVARRAPANCSFMGAIPHAQLDEFIGQARLTVVSSVWYEIQPFSLFEPMSQGKCVVCADIGSLAEFVEHDRTGMLFKAGAPDDLATKIQHLWDRPARCRELGAAARAKVLREFSPELAYLKTMNAYDTAIERAIERPLVAAFQQS